VTNTRTRRSGRGAAVGTALVVLLPVALTACGTGGDDGKDGAGTPSAVSSPTPSPSPTVDPAVYRRTLDSTLGPVDKAFRAVDSAKEGKALDQAIAKAADSARSAAAVLESAEAPEDAVDGTLSLADSLRGLGDTLTDSQAGGGRCATSPRVELGSDPTALGGVRNAAGTLSGLGYPVHLKLPRTEKAKNRRLSNSSFIKDTGRSGLGKLTVKNGTDSDAVVTLARGKKTAFTVYLRKGGSSTVRSVNNGTYTVYFTMGEDWNSAKKSFTRDCSFEKFDDPADFHTRQVSGGTQYDVLTFSLAKSIGGNATTTGVPQEDFPS
jgi:hypothetical protein